MKSVDPHHQQDGVTINQGIFSSQNPHCLRITVHLPSQLKSGSDQPYQAGKRRTVPANIRLLSGRSDGPDDIQTERCLRLLSGSKRVRNHPTTVQFIARIKKNKPWRIRGFDQLNPITHIQQGRPIYFGEIPE
jgi:hypothetical protein